MKEGLNISVTFLYEKLSDPIRFWVMILGNLIVIVFLMACVIEGFKLSISEWGQFCPALHIPMTFPLLAVPIGFGITAMLHWELFIETLRNIHPGLSDDKVRERVVNPRT